MPGRSGLVPAPDTFVAGEASAVLQRDSNGSRRCRWTGPQRLSEAGLQGRPTLVQNVETLAHIGLIARFGAAWFRTVGTARDPGTRLIVVTGDVPAATVLEVPGTSRLDDVLRAAQADPDTLSAVLVGGYHGHWAAPSGAWLSAAGPARQTDPARRRGPLRFGAAPLRAGGHR